MSGSVNLDFQLIPEVKRRRHVSTNRRGWTPQDKEQRIELCGFRVSRMVKRRSNTLLLIIPAVLPSLQWKELGFLSWRHPSVHLPSWREQKLDRLTEYANTVRAIVSWTRLSLTTFPLYPCMRISHWLCLPWICPARSSPDKHKSMREV